MNRLQEPVGEQVAGAVRAFETRRTKHARKWVAVFLNEDTITIALHGSLTAAETVLAQSPVGIARVREAHRQLFARQSAGLRQQMKSLTGLDVRGVTAEIEPTTGTVVHVFTTDSVTEQFLPASPRLPARTRRNTDRSGRVARCAHPRRPEKISR